MRGGNGLLAVLTLGGAVSAAGGAVVIDMPPPPARPPAIESPEPPESAPALRLGDVALRRYAGIRYAPSCTSVASPGWWGWPYRRVGFGFGVDPSWAWSWNRGWNCGWGWGWGRGWNAWGFPSWCGTGLRSPYFGYSRFLRPQRSIHWTGAGFPGRGRWR
jgi:hypothetical protein